MSEKIYPASPRKRKQARDEGQVAKSSELVSLITLFCSLLFIYYSKDSLFRLMDKFMYILSINISNDSTVHVATMYITLALKYLLPLFLVLCISAFLGNYFQVGLKFTPKTLKVDLKKLNPISGFKRMFSKDSLVELVKALFKVIGVMYIAFGGIKSMLLKINVSYTEDYYVMFDYIFDNLFSIVVKICSLLLALSIMDFVYKKFKFEKDLKMTRQEMMDEYKQDEGSPLVKQKQREFARTLTKRQINKVSEATVLITNPTHYAIAIKYDKITAPIPMVLFKGVDEIAQAAKKIAKENNVPMVENRPLARTLYASVSEGDCIPVELFDAVASVIAYIYTINDSK